MHIGIIGCGNMGTGLAELLSPLHPVFLHDRDWNHTQTLAQKINAEAFQTLSEMLAKARVIFLAVKPQNLKEILPLLHDHLTAHHVLVSLLAGTPLANLKEELPEPQIARIMPNLAMLYGAGVVGIVDDPDMSLNTKQELKELLIPLGMGYWLRENQIDALTSLTGSGPAFFFGLIEAMINAGTTMGIEEADIQPLVMQMLKGSLTLWEKSQKRPGELIQQIASPRGTTEAGLNVMQKENVRDKLLKTFLAAYQRASEMNSSNKK